MAFGKHPETDPYGKPFAEGTLAADLAGNELLYSAALVFIKADWAELCLTFGFATWASVTPCLLCKCTRGDMYTDHRLALDNACWPEFTWNDYNAACDLNEVKFTVTCTSMLAKIVASLFYDKRKGGFIDRPLQSRARRGEPGRLVLPNRVGHQVHRGVELAEKLGLLASRDRWRCTLRTRAPTDNIFLRFLLWNRRLGGPALQR